MPHRLVEATRSVRHHPWLGLAAGLVIVAAAFAIRFALGSHVQDVTFITLLPAVLLAALVGGLFPGILVAAVSALGGAFLFLPPYWSFALEWPDGYIAVTSFVVIAAIELLIINSLNRSVDGLATERDRVAILFRELQHRVANNMSFIASLLRLERRAVAARPDDADAILREAEKRLETMARIHRRLYDPSIVTTPLGAYLEALAGDILEATGAKNIRCIVEVPPVTFELSRLVTLSLLVTEVITNSVKHGFAGRAEGTLEIVLDRKAEDYVLSISDDGQGMPDAAACEQNASLGMTIINSLATQLNAQLSWSTGPGTTARVVFKA